MLPRFLSGRARCGVGVAYRGPVNWELVIAAAGLGLGLFNVVAWWIERRDRRAEVAEERRVRNEQLEIEKGRFRVEQEERERRTRADITAGQQPFKVHRDGRRTYRVKLTNMGPSYSKHVTGWLVDSEGRKVSGRPVGQPLAQGESRMLGLDIAGDIWTAEPPVRLMVEWFNDQGEMQVEASNLQFRWDY
jgi:hypothetical protein